LSKHFPRFKYTIIPVTIAKTIIILFSETLKCSKGKKNKFPEILKKKENKEFAQKNNWVYIILSKWNRYSKLIN
jgi:hypothetical protein